MSPNYQALAMCQASRRPLTSPVSLKPREPGEVGAVVIHGHLSAQDPRALGWGDTCPLQIRTGLRFDPGLLAPHRSSTCFSPSPLRVPRGTVHTPLYSWVLAEWPGTRNINIPWELARNAESRATPRTTEFPSPQVISRLRSAVLSPAIYWGVVAVSVSTSQIDCELLEGRG